VRRSFRALTAETLATASDGRGVFFRNRYGKGTVYTLACPLEARLYKTAGKYETDASRIYSLVTSPWRVMRTHSRDVVTTEHCFGGGKCGVVVVNNSPKPYAGTPELAANWRVTDALTDDGEKAKWTDGRLELAGNSGILLMTEKKDK